MIQPGEDDELPMQEVSGEILSIAERREALDRQERLRCGRAYCGPCFDAGGEINDLVPHLMRLPDGEKATWHSCSGCGEEFAG